MVAAGLVGLGGAGAHWAAAAVEPGGCCSGWPAPLAGGGVQLDGDGYESHAVGSGAGRRGVMVVGLGVKAVFFGAYVVGDAARARRCGRCRSS